MKFGNFEVYPLLDGFFALDGGAMFGTVPKVFWEKTNPADERNRIRLALRTLLVKTEKELVLVDTGIGDKFNDKFRDIYWVNKRPTIEESLAQFGIRPEDISIVINTHLHFDHAGGNTKIDKGGKVVPRFPKAKYFIQKREWEMANNPDCRSQASYQKENFLPLKEYNNLVLVDKSYSITEGVEVILTGGHTPGHQIVFVRSEDKRLVYWGDLIPTTSHLKIPYVMGYDLFPLTTMAEKEKYLKLVKEEKWVMAFEHDPKIAFAYFTDSDKIKECPRDE